MSDHPGPHGFVYLQTDIPDGLAIGEWRAQRAGERRSARIAVRAARHRHRRRRLFAGSLGRGSRRPERTCIAATRR